MAEQLLDYALCSVDDVRLAFTQHDGSVLKQGINDNIVFLINHFTVSAESPRWCHRFLRKAEYTEFHDGGWPFVTLDAPPVAVQGDGFTPDIEVWEDSDRVWADTSKLTVWDDYTVRRSLGQNGALVERNGCWVSGPRTVKVVYQGGLVTPAPSPDNPAGAPAAGPYDLRFACAKQVAAWWSRRLDMNLQAISTPGAGSITLMQDPTKLLDDTKRVLLRYKMRRP